MAPQVNLREQAAGLPCEPGVYLFFDAAGKVLYVGKAAQLRKRVQSYLREAGPADARIAQMVGRAERLECRRTASEAEALLLEAELIKAYRPPYNVLFRDDKSYPMLKVTAEAYPRLMKTRRRKPDGGHYFGPYVNATQVNEALEYLRRVFPMRTCNVFPDSPCLEYHLGKCLAPCAGYIDKRGYERIVKDLLAFLRGEKDALLRDLKRRMERASRARSYEEAARLRDQIEALTSVVVARDRSQAGGALEQLREALNLQTLPRRIEAFDISNTFGAFAVGSMVVFEDGRPRKSDYRRFRIETVSGIDDYAMMAEVVRRRYGGSLAQKLPLPDLVLIDGGKGQLGVAVAALKGLGLGIPAIGLAKRFEHIVLPERDEPIVLLAHSPVLHLMQAVRDEAHRFAITYHRLLRGKAAERSLLEAIPGIGRKRAQQLLQRFAGLAGVAAAPIAELRQTARLSLPLAERVRHEAALFARQNRAREAAAKTSEVK